MNPLLWALESEQNHCRMKRLDSVFAHGDGLHAAGLEVRQTV